MEITRNGLFENTVISSSVLSGVHKKRTIKCLLQCILKACASFSCVMTTIYRVYS